MSYILEALKKAQAERQLGSTPGIHDTPVASTASHAAPAPVRLWLALGGALLLAGAGYAAIRFLEKPQQALLPEPSVLAAVAAAPLPVEVPARPAAPQAPAPAIVAQVAPAAEAVSPAPVAAPQPEAPVPAPALAQMPAPVPAQAQAQVQAEESLPTLASLDPGLAASIPRVALAGYIYSPVPSERLVLVDKDLRREGEEVAPGLILEKLLPSGAVMNYRGTRFRMPY